LEEDSLKEKESEIMSDNKNQKTKININIKIITNIIFNIIITQDLEGALKEKLMTRMPVY